VEKKLTEEEIRSFAKNPNRDIRRKAAESMNSVYLVHQNQITLGNLYTGIVKNWSSSMELRGYKTVMSKRNISEQVPDNVVDTLMSEVQKFYPLYQRFLRAKQKHMQRNQSRRNEAGVLHQKTLKVLRLRCARTDLQNREKNPLRRSLQNCHRHVWRIW
jgi:oligoendopeptidase F